jgi:hypothetical protein
MEKTDQDNIEPAQARSENGSVVDMAKNVFTEDEYQLAQIGYKQSFIRSLGFFESWYVFMPFVLKAKCTAG